MSTVSNRSDVGYSDQTNAIWNPNAAANWSFLFTPAFGSYLQMLNWKTLQQSGKAATAKVWFVVSLVMLAAFVGINVFAAKQGADGGAANGLALLYLLVWYFAAARGQAKYVKQQFGTSYPRKSWFKPVLVGVAGMVAYVALTIGAASALGKAGNDEADAGSHGSLFSLGSLFADKGLDCASPDVKRIITDNYTEQLTETGVPDLAIAIAHDRIKFHVDMITETDRNNESKNVQCSGKLVIEFPKDDLEKAAQTKESKVAEVMVRKYKAPSDPVFSSTLTYLVSIPADKEERKNGPIVKMTMRNNDNQGDLGPYITAYAMLAYSTPDITAASKNEKAWDKEWKAAGAQECSKQLNPELCACKMDQFEKIVSQEDMHRISYSIQTNPLLASKYVNFVTLSENLNKQCPPVQGVAALLTTPENASPMPAPEAQPAEQGKPETAAPVPQAAPDAKPQAVVEPEAKKAVIEASFDCAKASSKIEKLICSSPDTANADKRLATVYGAAKSKSGDEQKLKSEQLQWMKEKRNSCNDAACLVRVTEERIQKLSSL
jgi:uncharacterized protein YecT (DUF1311 family)